MVIILSEAPVSRAKLLAWLGERSNAKSALVGAIYSALADRIKRGEFDSEETE